MTRMVSSLNRREMFSASMVFFLGLYYILVFISSLFQVKSLNLSIHLLVEELQWLVSGMLFASGGILMFLRKPVGWVISAATLLNFVVITFVNIVSLSQIINLNAYVAINIGFFLLLFLAFIFLFNRSTRKKYTVNNKGYLFTIVLYFIMIGVTFWLSKSQS